MSVPNQIPESNYVGNGTTTTFAANFEYTSDSDVFVTVNGIAPEIGQATFANGVFTFVTAPANGAAVRVYRSTPIERDTEYDNHDNVFRPRVVNIDFDRIWYVLQEYLLSLGITNAKITQEIADRIQADAEMMNYILNEDNELKADYILRDENLKKYVDQTIGALLDLPDFKGIEAQFVKDSSGKSQQEINTDIKTYLDNFPFYIPYSSLVSDYGPQFKTALESGRPIVLTQDAVYPILTQVLANVTKGVQITGNFATLSYEGASHIGDFISIKSSIPIKHYFYSLNVDGKHKATRVLYIEATQNNTVGLSYAYFNNSHVKRAKRSTAFVSIGGNGISIRGAFSAVDLEYSKVSDCALGAGAGIVGSVGINGLSVTNLNSTAYPLELNLTGFTVENIYSEDPNYIDDQDGVVFFGADGLIEKSVANITALNATNCWGRSVKTQCRVTNVIGGTFTRTEGNATKVGNGEIDWQMGVGFVKGANFRYFNGYQPGAVLSMSAHSSIPRSSYTAEDCDVYLDAATTIDCFIRTFPRTSKFGLITAKNCKIYGKAINFASLRYRGDRNIFEVQGCYVAQIVADPALDNQLNFIAVRSSGSVSGETNTVELNLFNNINDGSEAYLVRDGVSGSSMITTQNGRGNVGFVDSGVISGSGGQKSLVPFRATAYAGKDSNVSYSNSSQVIYAGNTAQFTLPDNTHLIGVQVRGVPVATCMVAHGSTGGLLNQIGANNVVYSAGITEPTTQGTWLTMWRDSANSNIINIKNNNVSNRTISLHFFTS